MWLIDELSKKRNENKPAIIHREESVSFKELWNKSDKLAYYIQKNCKSKAPILIYGNKDIDINIVMLSSLKTGRAYVPVDITFPVERLLQISCMVNCEIVFNFSDLEINGDFQVIDKNRLYSDVYDKIENTELSSDEWVKPEDTCYILFTSGSTGLPKGVQITRKNIENFVNWFSKDCEISSDSQYVLNQVSYSFDVSVIPLYIYLPMGKTLFSIDKGMIDNIQVLFEYLKLSNIALWISTPAFLEICSFDDSFNSEMMPQLSKFILAGEVLTKKLVKSIHNKFEGSVVINGYGPTEGTVLLSACEITEDMLNDEQSLPIGKVIPESTYTIVGEDGKPVPEGAHGELVVISDSISKGYYNNPAQTNKVFFSSDDGRMGYKTGDLVYEKKGMLYYIARKDFQIKLNGYRIELDDISNNLNKIEFISNNIVLPVYKEERVSYIIAFVILNTRPDMSNVKIGIQIKNELRNLVPSYMVPRKIVILDKFPLNTNGKIDRKKLMEDM